MNQTVILLTTNTCGTKSVNAKQHNTEFPGSVTHQGLLLLFDFPYLDKGYVRSYNLRQMTRVQNTKDHPTCTCVNSPIRQQSGNFPICVRFVSWKVS